MRKFGRKRPLNSSERRTRDRAATLRYYYNNKDERDAQSREWYRKNTEYAIATARRTNYQKNYGVTIEEAEQILKNQNGKCAICKEKILLSGANGAHLDHDHQSKQNRGILCSQCNRGLGHFKDNIDRLFSAINYLKDFKCRNFKLVDNLSGDTTKEPTCLSKQPLINPFEKAG